MGSCTSTGCGVSAPDLSGLGLTPLATYAPIPFGQCLRLLHRFTVPGHPVGYYAQGKRPNWTRMLQYRAYAKTVREAAAKAGVKLPLEASKTSPLYIEVWPYFKTGVHSDPGNVQKGCVDSLFYGAKGGDKWTGGAYPPPRYDEANPRLEVLVWQYEEGAK